MQTLTISNTLREAVLKLRAISSSPNLDAEILLAHILDKDRVFLRAWSEKRLTAEQFTTFDKLLQRRLQHEPIAYILGNKEFWSLNLKVNKNVLIPRPETELLVEIVLRQFSAEKTLRLADLGTGSGAVALAIAKERQNWSIIATDISLPALKIAQENAHHLKISNITFYHGDWCLALPNEQYDVIVSNPPYIAHDDVKLHSSTKFEPQHSLLADEDGLSDIKTIIQQAKLKLSPHGMLLIEHSFMQGNQVRQLLNAAGYSGAITHSDLAGLDRATLAYCTT